MAVKLSALRAGLPLAPKRFLVLISIRSWVDPRVTERLEGLSKLKNAMISSGIEPATFQLAPITLPHYWYVRNCVIHFPCQRQIDKLTAISRATLCWQTNRRWNSVKALSGGCKGHIELPSIALPSSRECKGTFWILFGTPARYDLQWRAFPDALGFCGWDWVSSNPRSPRPHALRGRKDN
jgi:hypothetical protein